MEIAYLFTKKCRNRDENVKMRSCWKWDVAISRFALRDTFLEFDEQTEGSDLRKATADEFPLRGALSSDVRQGVCDRIM